MVASVSSERSPDREPPAHETRYRREDSTMSPIHHQALIRALEAERARAAARSRRAQGIGG